MPLTYGAIDPMLPGSICDLCPLEAAVKARFEDRTVHLCDIHAFVHSDLIWENADAIYDRVDILPPKPEN